MLTALVGLRRGEHPDATAIRETEEETGVVAEIKGLVSVMTMLWDDEPLLYLVFLAGYVSGEPRADGKEVDAASDLPGDLRLSLTPRSRPS